MANCGDLERDLRDMNRRIRDLERRTGGSGGTGNNLDEENIIRKTIERVFKDNRWMQAVGILGMLSTGKAGITSLGNLQSPASSTWKRGVDSLNRAFEAKSAAGAAKGKAAEALSKSLDAQLKSKAAREAASNAGKAANTAKTVSKIAKDEATLAKNAAGGVKRTAEQAKKMAEASKALSELNKKNIVKEAQKVTKEVQKVTKEIDKKTKPLQDAYKKLDGGLQRITKGLDKFAAAAGLAFGIAGVAIGFMALFASERNQAAFDRQINAFQVLGSKELGLMQQLKSRIDKVIKRTEVLEKEADLVSDAVKANKITADAAKKQANDITYEARVKLQRLNDGLYVAKTQAARADEATKQFNGKIQQANLEIKKANAEIAKANNEASQARVGVRLVDTKATNAAAEAKQARVGVQLVDSKATTALTTAQQLPAKIPAIVQGQITPAIAPIKTTNAAQDGEIAALKNRVTAIQNTPKTNTPTPNNPSPVSLEVIKPLVNQAVNTSIAGSGILPRLGAAEIKADTALKQSTAALSNPEPIGRNALALGGNNAAAIDKLNQDIQQLKAPNVLEPRLRTVEAKVQEREKMDAAANQKLDYQRSQLEQLVIATGGIGLMLPRILGGLDGLPDKTASAVAGAPCGKGCGGRTAQRVDDLAGELGSLRNQVNGLPNTVANVVNAGANASQIPLLNTINNKLGAPVPGGIGGLLNKFSESFEKFAQWSHLDRLLNILTFTTTVHNAYQVSSGLSQTLFSMVSNVLAAVGIKDKDNNPLDINKIVGTTVENLFKAVLGVETVDGIKTEWKKYNRIYQAASNIVNSFQSIGYSILGAAEVLGNWIAAIGNALKAGGVLGENVYKWMNPQVDFQNRFFTTINNIENVVSNIDQVAQETLSIQETVGQLGTQKQDLDKALAQVDGSRQTAGTPEAAKVATAATVQKTASSSPAIASSDTVKPEG